MKKITKTKKTTKAKVAKEVEQIIETKIESLSIIDLPVVEEKVIAIEPMLEVKNEEIIVQEEIKESIYETTIFSISAESYEADFNKAVKNRKLDSQLVVL